MLPLQKMVRAKRLELIRLSAPDPKSGASAIPPRPRIEAQQSLIEVLFIALVTRASTNGILPHFQMNVKPKIPFF
jgi:hypothetical protein